jgi:type VI secretion system protein ImpG
VSDSLLAYFNRELEALRGLAGEFAERHPKIAGRLRLTKDTVDDPHVGRLLEGVAFLGARVQHRLDDEFPELTDGLLSVLYPHYLAPMPSVAITRFAADPEMPGPAHLPAGLAVETEPVGGEACLFRTAYPLTLWPVEVDAVRLSGMPLPAPPNPAAAGAVSCLRISLRCANPAMTFTQLGLDRLRLFLGGERGSALLELLLAHTISIALADDQTDARPVILPPDTLQAVGFARPVRSLAFACSANISRHARNSCSSTSAASMPRRSSRPAIAWTSSSTLTVRCPNLNVPSRSTA